MLPGKGIWFFLLLIFSFHTELALANSESAKGCKDKIIESSQGTQDDLAIQPEDLCESNLRYYFREKEDYELPHKLTANPEGLAALGEFLAKDIYHNDARNPHLKDYFVAIQKFRGTEKFQGRLKTATEALERKVMDLYRESRQTNLQAEIQDKDALFNVMWEFKRDENRGEFSNLISQRIRDQQTYTEFGPAWPAADLYYSLSPRWGLQYLKKWSEDPRTAAFPYPIDALLEKSESPGSFFRKTSNEDFARTQVWLDAIEVLSTKEWLAYPANRSRLKEFIKRAKSGKLGTFGASLPKVSDDNVTNTMEQLIKRRDTILENAEKMLSNSS